MNPEGAAVQGPVPETPPAATSNVPGWKKWLFISQWIALRNTQDPKDFWDGIKNIAQVIALIVGALWIGITFRTLGSATKARADIEYVEAQNARIRDQPPVLELSIDATQLKPGDKNEKGHFVAIIVTVKNIGTRNMVVCFEQPIENLMTNCPLKNGQPPYRPYVAPLTIAYAGSSPDLTKTVYGGPRPVDLVREDILSQPLKGLDLKVGQTELLTALVPLEKTGFYRVAFSVPESEEARQVARELKPIWSISKFIVIRDNSELRL